MVGPLIRTARKARGWTQRELALRAGVSRRTVANAERGVALVRNPHLVRRLAELLDLERDPPQEQSPRPWSWRGLRGKR